VQLHSELSFSPCSQWSVCPAACTATAASAEAAAAANSQGLSNSQTNSRQDPHENPLNSKINPKTPYELKTETIVFWWHEVIEDLQYIIKTIVHVSMLV